MLQLPAVRLMIGMNRYHPQRLAIDPHLRLKGNPQQAPAQDLAPLKVPGRKNLKLVRSSRDMTFASKITLGRIALVPVFAVYVVRYGVTVAGGQPEERLRWTALALFILASATDGVDGWVARRFNQKSKFGAFIDPLADKFLLMTAILMLSAFPWGSENWRMPPWFAVLVITRDLLIGGGIFLVKKSAHEVHYSPHWTGKVCTVTQMIAIGWVMLKVGYLPPLYPCLVAAVFTLWSAFNYYQEASRQIRQRPAAQP